LLLSKSKVDHFSSEKYTVAISIAYSHVRRLNIDQLFIMISQSIGFKAFRRKHEINSHTLDNRVTKKRKTQVILALYLLPIMLYQYFSMESPKIERKASIDLGNGNCKWTKSFPLPIESDPFGTLIASYPASGMRVVWQQIEGLTSIRVGDDYQYGGDRVGMIKTQYPHYEGIWSYGSTLDQVILVTRNPRWAIPSFHHILSELNYAQEWSDVNEYIMNIFTKRSIMENWIKWRDLKAFSEINLWGWHIDFYMENGTQYWNDLDFERIGQKPFFFFNESNKPWPINEHCVFDIDCVPVAHVSYDKMRNPDTGPGELSKIANILREKKGMTVLSDEAIECIWNQTWTFSTAPRNENRDISSPSASDYKFTNTQLQAMLDKLEFMKNKYNSTPWINHPIAQDLVLTFDVYIKEVAEELEYQNENPVPTPAPNPDYYQSLVDWYATVGQGDRYNVDKVRGMRGYWPLVKNFYGEE